jgi:hypothetical protein
VNVWEVVAAVLGALGVGAILQAVVTGVFGRHKVAAEVERAKADAAAVIGEAARELLQPMRDRLHEMAQEEKRLRHRVEDLEADLRWLRAERADQIRRDAAMQHHMRALNAWVDVWLPQARSLGLEVPDPPIPPQLLPLIDPTQLLAPTPRAAADDEEPDLPRSSHERHPWYP